jgi:eukaryotic-like serine/threonine-protein kinase
MIQATSCPSAPVLQRLLLGQSAEEESVSLEAHLLQCEKCLHTVQSLPPDDALLSALQNGRDFATQAPRSELLEKLRMRLQEMPASSRGADTATAENTHPNAPTPSAEMLGHESVSLGPPQQPDEIGRLGGYRVLKELGRGGMGAVYQADDPKLKRLVALKVMLPRLAADASARRRFLREAQAMAAVHHDHVVTIFQVDEDNGVPFLAMEFLHGMPLDKWLKDGRKPNLAQILRMGREIAEGLAAAHARGLVHRDVKPGNIWLDSDHKGRVKILDFGLARVGTEDVHLTRTGAVVGTPAYMSPEQAGGEKVDPRTDLFSLGCVLYRFCTGAMPFAGNTTMAVLNALATTHPKPVRDMNPDVPAALADLVMHLLAKEPGNRPASAREVAERIAAIEKNPKGKMEEKKEDGSQTVLLAPDPRTSPSHPVPSSRRRTTARALLAAAAALVVAAAGAVVYVQTDRGTLEIKTSDPDVKVSVEQNGTQVDVLDPKSKQQLSIHSGKYTLKLIGADGAEHEMVIDQGPNPVTLTRGGKVVVTVSRVDKPGEAAKTSFAPLDKAWVEKVQDLPPEKQVEEVAAELTRRNPGFDGKVTSSVFDGKVKILGFFTDKVTDLTPVRALPDLGELDCQESVKWKSRLSDLSPLKGMKLTVLTCVAPKLADLTPLKDIPLTYLAFGNTQVSDLSPLKGMLLTTLGCTGGAKVSDLSPLRGMKLESLDCSGTAVSDLSPLKGMKLVTFYCYGTPVSDLSPLKDMPLTYLHCDDTQVSDLSPLKGMLLTFLACGGTPVSDLSPLKDMPLTWLSCGTRVSDLSPLKGMLLTFLACDNSKITDLSPLKDMPLTALVCHGTKVSDLSPLRGMKLDTFSCDHTPVSDLSPLKDMKLTDLWCDNTLVSDLSLLKEMPLKNLRCDFKPERDTEILRSIKTLEKINDKPAAEFWKEVDGK